MMRIRLGLLSGLALFLGGCQQATSPVRPGGDNPSFSKIDKVKVDAVGNLSLNGRTVSLEELKAEFQRLKKMNGAVWYHRDNPTAKPNPKAMQVIQAIIDAKLPVRLVEKDFDK